MVCYKTPIHTQLRCPLLHSVDALSCDLYLRLHLVHGSLWLDYSCLAWDLLAVRMFSRGARNVPYRYAEFRSSVVTLLCVNLVQRGTEGLYSVSVLASILLLNL